MVCPNCEYVWTGHIPDNREDCFVEKCYKCTRTVKWIPLDEFMKGRNMIGPFEGDYRFLSNFYQSPVEFEGYCYPTAEHAFQAAKSLNEEDRFYIRAKPTPGLAKKAGRALTLREDWEDVKYDIMKKIVKMKFEMNNDLKRKLVATGDQELVEINWWGDRVWGVCDGKGTNWLGKILVEVRKELR